MQVMNLQRMAAAAIGAAVASAALFVSATSPANADSAGSSQCRAYESGQWVTISCSYSTGGGAGEVGGSGAKTNFHCTFTPLAEAGALQLGLSWPPPRGESYALMDCLGGSTGVGPQVVLVNSATLTPAVTPEQLMGQALNHLQIPVIRARTAPPAGKEGLVGLPEWFWIPGGHWHSVSATVTAGTVWATATGTPIGFQLNPGQEVPAVPCAGPGIAYNPALSSAAQHTDCSYTYTQPSESQPGNTYQASVIVTWRVSWRGSGGSGGVLSAGLAIPFPIAIRVAQGEALVTGGSS